MTTTRELCRLLSATLHIPGVDRWAEQLGSRELLPGLDHELYALDAARTAIAVIETGSLEAQDDDYGEIPFDAAPAEQAEDDRTAQAGEPGPTAEHRVEGQGAALDEGAPEAGGAAAGEEVAAEAAPPPTTETTDQAEQTVRPGAVRITASAQTNGLRFYDQHSAEIADPDVVSAAQDSPRAASAVLRAVFVADERAYTGARCELPLGKTVEVHHKRTPFFALCRELEARGYGDRRIEISTPEGTPSMRGLVKVMAGMRIEESDRGGLKQRKFEPFPGAGAAKERDLGPEGTQTPENEEKRVSESTVHEKAA